MYLYFRIWQKFKSCIFVILIDIKNWHTQIMKSIILNQCFENYISKIAATFPRGQSINVAEFSAWVVSLSSSQGPKLWQGSKLGHLRGPRLAYPVLFS